MTAAEQEKRMYTRRLALYTQSLFLALLLCSASFAAAADRPAAWAEPVVSPGVSNLHKVTDDLYRSAQPDTADMKALEAMGIRTVISLRALHSDDDEARGTSLILRRIPINTWSISVDEVVAALRMVRESEKPVLLHCQHGADRTGLVMAVYRVAEQGWSREEAMDEMLNGGYGFHSIWKNIPVFLQNADIDVIKRRVNE